MSSEAASTAPSVSTELLKKRARQLAPFGLLALATAWVARTCIKTIYEKVGHPGAALDDAYIHFQYARAIVEFHPFRFQAGEPISTGGTSFLWPVVLAIPYALGFKGDAIMWPAWLLAFGALGGLAYESHRLAKPLTSASIAAGAAAMTLLFGGLVWCAASGMEVVPFSWLLATTIRRASEWVEEPSVRTKKNFLTLLAVALAAPLMRPEGALFTLVAGAAVALAPRDRTPVRRFGEPLLFAGAALVPNVFLFFLTGSPTSSTAQVKLLFGNPYHPLGDTSVANARILVNTLLQGEVWSAEFLPKGGGGIAFAGLAALLVCGFTTRRWFRVLAVLLFALAMFVPCTYVTFLWNRLRYLWPFAPGWFIGLACLARVVSMVVARIHPRSGVAIGPVLAGLFAGMFAVRLEWVIEDVAQSASGIARQQSALGKWANDNLPKDARIAVNDTGAIAYFGNRRTFDIVGLTTASEGRYWVMGTASRVEHYERMKATTPQLLPTHFIVYPEWMGTSALYGLALHEAVVTDSTILGGQIMRAYDARWDVLGSGDAPWTPMQVVDTLDVADIESEAEHAYALLEAREGEQVVELGNAPNAAMIIDGGRTGRSMDRFVAKLPEGKPVRGVARVQVESDTTFFVRVGEQEVAVPVEGPLWTEMTFDIPANLVKAQTPIEVKTRGVRFTSFHYWFGPALSQ